MSKLTLVTGPSGAGKSSIIPYLKQLLPLNYKIYDFDEIWKPYDFSDTWEDRVIEHCVRVQKENSNDGFETVILGLIRPWKFLDIQGINPDFIHLDITETERTKRLEKRSASKSLVQDLKELKEFRKWFKGSKYPSIDTSEKSIMRVAQEVFKLISKNVRTQSAMVNHFLTVRLTKQESLTIKSYDKHAEAWSSKHFTFDYWKKEFQIFKKYLPSGKIIELGCGGGRDAKILSNLGYEYVGTDVSKGLISQARKNNPNIKFLRKTLYNLNFEQDAFDGFWASAVFLHIPKNRIDSVLQNITKIIKPNGIGFISIKQGEGEYFENEDSEGLARLWSYYSLEEFRSTLERNSFEVLNCYTDKRSEKTTWLVYFVKVLK